MAIMRAMAMTAQGSVAALEPMELPMPEPGPNEVRVAVHASAVNAADYKVATGTGGARFVHARSFPLIPGYDFSGTIDAAGSAVSQLRIGDDVFGHLPYRPGNRRGSFAEYVVAAAREVARKPPAIRHEVAAAAATAGLTALQALRDRGQLRAGGRAFIIGASGGVGALAIAVAKQLGAHVTGLCSSDVSEFVRGLGAEEIVDRASAQPLRRDASYDVIFDTPAAYSFLRTRQLLAPGGTYVTTLPSAGFVAGKLAALLSSRRCKLVAVQSRPADLEQLATWITAGMPVAIEARYPVRAAATAITAISGGRRRGRLVVDVANGW